MSRTANATSMKIEALSVPRAIVRGMPVDVRLESLALSSLLLAQLGHTITIKLDSSVSPRSLLNACEGNSIMPQALLDSVKNLNLSSLIFKTNKALSLTITTIQLTQPLMLGNTVRTPCCLFMYLTTMRCSYLILALLDLYSSFLTC